MIDNLQDLKSFIYNNRYVPLMRSYPSFQCFENDDRTLLEIKFLDQERLIVGKIVTRRKELDQWDKPIISKLGGYVFEIVGTEDFVLKCRINDLRNFREFLDKEYWGII